MVSQNQKSPTQNKNLGRKILPVLAIVGLLAVVAVGSFFLTKLISEKTKGDTTSSSNATSSRQDSDMSEKDTSKAETTEPSNASQSETTIQNPQTPQQYEGPDPNTFENVTGAISYMGELDGVFSVRVAIDQTVNGSCTFTIRNPNGVVYTDIAPTEAGPTSTFCAYKGSAPIVNGLWSVMVVVTGLNGYTGTISGEARV